MTKMLSRVADNLYWMSRYVERAEGVTRLVEVNRDTDLEFQANETGRDYWQSALSAMCAMDDFANDEIDDQEFFILFSKNWSSSVLTCINMARENARMVRDQLSEEIWVELNNLYLFLNSPALQGKFRSTQKIFPRIIAFPSYSKDYLMLRFIMMKDGDLCRLGGIWKDRIRPAESWIR